MSENCNCGSLKSYQECCGQYIEARVPAPTPEALMRSRYVAFTQKNMDYLIQTHDPQTIQDFDGPSQLKWSESVRFIQLEVIQSQESGNKGIVEFKATFEDLKTRVRTVHHEISKFRKQQGIWYFRQGRVAEEKMLRKF